MSESTFQKKVIDRYRKLGFYVIKLSRTNKGGIMDLVALKPGEVIFIEVKGEKTPHSPLQKFRKRELERLGFSVVVERDVEK